MGMVGPHVVDSAGGDGQRLSMGWWWWGPALLTQEVVAALLTQVVVVDIGCGCPWDGGGSCHRHRGWW